MTTQRPVRTDRLIRGFLRTSADMQRHELTPGWPFLVAATGADTGNSFGVVEEGVAPGAGPPLLVHDAADELAYILAGQFTWQIAELRANGGVGSIAFVPRGTAHTWQNTGSEPARMLFVFTPGGFERFLLELSARPQDTRTLDSLNAMSMAYRTKYVGPQLAGLPQ